MNTKKRTTSLAALFASLLLVLTGCGAVTIPSDPNGTLKEITGGTLRVGVTEFEPWVQLEPGQEPQGVEPDLVREFADARDAGIEWVQGAEHELAEQIKHDKLDIIIGGIASDTPWMKHAGVTKPYVETVDPRGKTVKHVMLVPLGENRFLLTLDKFLQSQQVNV